MLAHIVHSHATRSAVLVPVQRGLGMVSLQPCTQPDRRVIESCGSVLRLAGAAAWQVQLQVLGGPSECVQVVKEATEQATLSSSRNAIPQPHSAALPYWQRRLSLCGGL